MLNYDFCVLMKTYHLLKFVGFELSNNIYNVSAEDSPGVSPLTFSSLVYEKDSFRETARP